MAAAEGVATSDGARRVIRIATPGALVLAALLPTVAAAAVPSGPAPTVLAAHLLDWRLDPLALGLGGVIGWAYLRGLARAYRRDAAPADWRPIAFLTGLAVMVLALVSPLAVLAGDSYLLRQVQIAGLRVVGPFLMFIAAPWGLVHAGLPAGWRTGPLRSARRSRPARALDGLLGRPLALAVLVIALFYLSQLPPVQDFIVRSRVAAYALCLLMGASGLLFFAALFDERDPPRAMAHGHRMMMLVATILSQILFGVAMTLKPMVLYAAYGGGAAVIGLGPLDDEAAGGFLNWSAVSMVLLVTILFVFGGWNRAEERYWARAFQFRGSNSAALFIPETAEELWLVVAAKNRRVALGLAIIPFVMMGLAIGTVVGVHFAR